MRHKAPHPPPSFTVRGPADLASDQERQIHSDPSPRRLEQVQLSAPRLSSFSLARMALKQHFPSASPAYGGAFNSPKWYLLTLRCSYYTMLCDEALGLSLGQLLLMYGWPAHWHAHSPAQMRSPLKYTKRPFQILSYRRTQAEL